MPEKQKKRQPEELPDPIGSDLLISQPQPQTPDIDMEVHHHPDLHHKRKKFRECFLEFLMIFLAVSMGFFAESFREHITENAKEKEYIVSMLEDVQTDTSNIHAAMKSNSMRVLRLDSLATLCFNYNPAEKKDPEIYRLYRFGLIHPDFISPTERTLSQLKNSGAMRLIRKKAVIDSIVLYDDLAKKLADQQVYYERYQNESVQSSLHLINFSFYYLGRPFAGNAHSYDSARLLSNDKRELIEFGNRINIYEGVVAFYNRRLQETEAHAITLINTLRTQYHLENEGH
jgi:hypothetical protein